MTSLPLSERTSSTHFEVLMKLERSVNKAKRFGICWAIEGGKLTGNIVDDDGNTAISYVGRNQGTESVRHRLVLRSWTKL